MNLHKVSFDCYLLTDILCIAESNCPYELNITQIEEEIVNLMSLFNELTQYSLVYWEDIKGFLIADEYITLGEFVKGIDNKDLICIQTS
jgi:hypothetical protein